MATTSPAAARTIELATLNWAPFYGESLPDGGPMTAAVRAAAKAVGHDITVTWLPWKRALTLARAGRFDGVLGAYRNAERQRAFHFTKPFMTVRGGFIAKKKLDIRRYDSLRDLKPYRIGTLMGGEYPRHFDRADFLDTHPEPRNVENIKKFIHDRVDILAMAFRVFRHELQHFDSARPDDFIALKPPLWKRSLFVAISKQAPNDMAIVRDLNDGLHQIRSDGTLRRIIERHMPDRLPGVPDQTGSEQSTQ